MTYTYSSTRRLLPPRVSRSSVPGRTLQPMEATLGVELNLSEARSTASGRA